MAWRGKVSDLLKVTHSKRSQNLSLNLSDAKIWALDHCLGQINVNLFVIRFKLHLAKVFT